MKQSNLLTNTLAVTLALGIAACSDSTGTEAPAKEETRRIQADSGTRADSNDQSSTSTLKTDGDAGDDIENSYTVNDDGNIVDKTGNVVDEGDYALDEDGKIVDEDGEVVDVAVFSRNPETDSEAKEVTGTDVDTTASPGNTGTADNDRPLLEIESDAGYVDKDNYIDNPSENGCYESESKSQDYCEWNRDCEMEDGYAYASAYCYEEGDGLTCDCSSYSYDFNEDSEGHDTYYTLNLGDAALGSVCPSLKELCGDSDAPAPTSDAPRECALESTSSDPNYCYEGYRCSQDIELANGLSGTLDSYNNTDCQKTGDDEWRCSCSTNDKQLHFGFNDDGNALGVCPKATNLCATAELEAAGDVQCLPRSLDSGSNFCFVSLECTQQASLGDAKVEIYGTLYSECEESSDGLWDCYCNAEENESPFQVEGTSGFAACSDAAPICAGLAAESGTLNSNNERYYDNFDEDF